MAEPSLAYVARVQQLAADPATRVEVFGTELAVLRAGGGNRRVAIVAWQAGDDAAMQARLTKLVRAPDPLPVEIVLVGGPATARALLQKAKPWVTTGRRYLYHLPDDGPLWHDRSGPTHPLLVEPAPHVDQASWSALQEKVERSRGELAEEQGELSAFAGRQRAGRPVVTFTVLAMIAAVLGLQFAFGGGQADGALMRLGALSPRLVRAGEVWRLASCTFLHGGVMHALMNAYVIFILGSFLEKIIGPWRFALLYAAAAFGGSLVSFYTLSDAGMSVGASGAGWGCLGAHCVLAFRGRGLLPTAMIPGAKRAAVINLGLNVVVSFQPRVDWGAHFGGGLVGAALLYFVVHRGLPHLGEGDAAVDRRPPYIAPLAVLMGALLVGGLLTGILRGRAWELGDPPTFAPESLPALGVLLDVPRGLGPADPELVEKNVGEVAFGDIRADPALVAVVRFEGGPSGAEQVAAAQAQIREELGQQPKDGATVVDPPVVAEIAGKPAVRARYRYQNGIERQVFFIFATPGTMHRLEVYSQPGFPAWSGVADRVAASMRFAP
ncbi:MAG: rhomboid family intramembrane serine protease [Polyangiaceae bacterium]